MPNFNLVCPDRFDILLRGILTLLTACLLVVPTCALFELQPQERSQIKSRARLQMLIIFFFTLAFSACCSIFTKARKQEVFTATAAYSAVLVVFLSNTSQVMLATNSN
jgi:O-antigen ligase